MNIFGKSKHLIGRSVERRSAKCKEVVDVNKRKVKSRKIFINPSRKLKLHLTPLEVDFPNRNNNFEICRIQKRKTKALMKSRTSALQQNFITKARV